MLYYGFGTGVRTVIFQSVHPLSAARVREEGAWINVNLTAIDVDVEGAEIPAESPHYYVIDHLHTTEPALEVEVTVGGDEPLVENRTLPLRNTAGPFDELEAIDGDTAFFFLSSADDGGEETYWACVVFAATQCTYVQTEAELFDAVLIGEQGQPTGYEALRTPASAGQTDRKKAKTRQRRTVRTSSRPDGVGAESDN